MEKFRFCIKNKDRKEIRIMEVIIRKAKEKEGKELARIEALFPAGRSCQ